MSKISNYALWFDIHENSEQKILAGLKNIYNQLINVYEIKPSTTFNFEDMFLKVDKNFYLIKVEEHWSPGDISGFFKNSILDENEQVMSILISRDYYLPHHGMVNISQDTLSQWHNFPNKYEFYRKEDT